MHYSSPIVIRQLVAQDADGVVFGFARMYDHRQLRFPRQTQLTTKDFALHLARRVIVVIVEANLAPRNHPFALLDQKTNSFFRPLIKKASIVWMHAYTCVNVVVLFG